MTILLLLAGLVFGEPSACEKLDAELLKAMKEAKGIKSGPEVFRVISLKTQRKKLKCQGPVPKLEEPCEEKCTAPASAPKK